MLELNRPEWTEEKTAELERRLAKVFLEEWGGPRSPLALQYIHETIVPDLLQCIRRNADLLQNQTFAEIVAWKLRTQFAYPAAAAEPLAQDLIRAAEGLVERVQVTDVREPWRRIFRLWVSGESLPDIAERTGYPLDYLDLLLLRLRKLQKFMAGRGLGLLECLENEELREYGFGQLSFLYQFLTALSGEPLFQERLIMEQVIQELNLPLQVSDLVTLLEIIHEHEGEWTESAFIAALGEMARRPDGRGDGVVHFFPDILHGLMSVYWIQRNKSGRLCLSEKSAKALAGFILPRVTERLRENLKYRDMEQAQRVLLAQNPEVLSRIVDWVAREAGGEEAFQLLTGLYKRVNRRIDLCVIEACGRVPEAWEFVLGATAEQDSLIRAGACEALGGLGRKDAVPRLIECLEDEVSGVKKAAVQALVSLGDRRALVPLERLAADYAEPTVVREKAKEAVFDLSGT
ncbi:hypothetical protein CEB3_c15380 [Peptococcaceae bacterium CEB3]|nr:hypothetical protein CEB3_c15380 [Peptococcaceae bacterium CEB3]